ncbi:hypothetical protein ACFFX0_04905 [Citricoccus parietis]|uniref:Uncharacterized protein n=1 Tax=Citricoccus parietis TaxID=592307 RepID=A0ABV5FV58_9MICC
MLEAWAWFMVLATEYRPPVMRSPRSSSASPAMGWRRFCESAFTVGS